MPASSARRNLIDRRPFLRPGPAGIGGVLAWYGRADGTYQDSTSVTPAGAQGDPVGYLTDRSQAGNPALQATSARRGSLDFIWFQGSPALNLNGTSVQYVTFPNLAINPRDFSIFLSYLPTRLQAQWPIWGFGTFGSSAFTTLFTSDRQVQINVNGTATDLGIYCPGRRNYLNVISKDGTIRIRANGVQATVSAPAAGSPSHSGGALGRYISDSFVSWIDVAEFIVYGRGLSAGETADIEAYQATYASGFTAPAAYLGRPLLVFDGDSLTQGYVASDLAHSYPSQCVGGLTNPTNWLNYGINGQTALTAATYVSGYATLFEASRSRNVAIIWMGTNDMFFSATGATTYTRLVTLAQAARSVGFTVLLPTVLPRSGGGTPAGFEAERTTVNGNLRADFPTATAATRVFAPGGGITYADYLVDVAANGTIGDSGDELNTTYYNADKVHMTDAGYALIATDVRAALGLLGIT